MLVKKENKELCVKPIYAIPLLAVFSATSIGFVAYDLKKKFDEHITEMDALFDDMNTSLDRLTTELHFQFDEMNSRFNSMNTNLDNIINNLESMNAMLKFSTEFNRIQSSHDCITFFQLSADVEREATLTTESISYESFDGNCLDINGLGIGYDNLALPISDYKNLSMDVESHSLKP